MAKPKSPKKNLNGKDETLPTNGAAVESTVDPASALVAAEAPNGDANRKVRNTTRKPEIFKAESRSNLVPINLEDEIRRLAYLMSERRGFEPGHETEDWLAAEHEVRQRYHHQQTA